MKLIPLALGGFLLFLLGKTGKRPVTTLPAVPKASAPHPAAKPPAKGKQPPSVKQPPVKKPSSAPKPAAPRPAPAKGTSPYDKAAAVFYAAVVQGLTEAQARTAAIAAYRKAGGKSQKEIRLLSQMVYWD